MIKLSIITINLNNHAGLHRTIESVVGQTFDDYEYIIIDGASIDGSADTIKEFPSRINYWISEPDTGIFNAMNKGIRRAKGEYCLFLNSGDYFLNFNVLESVFSYSFNEEIVYGDLMYGKKIKVCPDKLTLKFFFQSSLGHPSTLIKTSLFEKFGTYCEDYRIASDWAFFMDVIINHNCSYRHLNNIVISHFNLNGISSTNASLMREEYETILKKMYPHIYEFYNDYQKLSLNLSLYENSKFFKLMKKIYDGPIPQLLKKAKGIKN